MISDIYTNRHGVEYILSEVDRIGTFCNLSHPSTAKLRLLAEEMLGLTVRLFDNLEYRFYIESAGACFTLNLQATAAINPTQKEKMLSLSSSGKNEATKGIFGKISGIFEGLLLDDYEFERIYIPDYDCLGIVSYFSLTSYQNGILKTLGEDQWDGLEKSIIANLAKDVIIGVRNSKTEMIVVVEF